jgi:hypothetical protein
MRVKVAVRSSVALAALVGVGAMLGALPAEAANWKVASGNWQTAGNWDPTGVPTSSDVAGFGVLNAEVTVTGSATAKNLYFSNDRATTLVLDDGASLEAIGDQTYVRTTGTGTHAIIQGPDNTDATVTLERINMAYGTGNSLVLSGAHLKVIFKTDSYMSAGAGNSFEITDGATVTGVAKGTTPTNNGGQFYTRGAGARTTIDGGTLNGTLLYVSNTDGVGGLLQLGENGHIALSTGVPDKNGITITVVSVPIYTGGRFEAEGSGMGSSVLPHIYSGGTLAVGVNPVGGSQSAAKTLTLQSTTTIDNGGILEMSLFGNGQNDQINLATGGKVANGTGTGTVLQLVLGNEYAPHAGDSWTLFKGLTLGNITGKFDLSQIDSAKYNTDQFNQAGGWIITAVPEPTAMGLLLIGGIGAMTRRRRSEERPEGDGAGMRSL